MIVSLSLCVCIHVHPNLGLVVSRIFSGSLKRVSGKRKSSNVSAVFQKSFEVKESLNDFQGSIWVFHECVKGILRMLLVVLTKSLETFKVGSRKL